MRLLAFSDLHCDRTAAAHLADLAREVDVVVGAGDFAIQHRGLDDTIRALASITVPAVLVPGNGEYTEALEGACRAHWPSATVLHGTGTSVGGHSFFGLGGGVPITPFGDWSFDLSEDQARVLLEDCPDHAVLVTHSPPRDACDLDAGGTPLGSLAIREAVVRRKPRLVICGHVHASWTRRARIGDSMVVNAGPQGVLLTVSPDGEVG